MAEIIARFADGRLLVKEDKVCEARYCGSGVFFRVGHVRKVEEVLSVDTNYSDEGLLTPLKEARPYRDGLYVVMRRGDIGTPTLTGEITSGFLSGALSGLSASFTLPGPIGSGTLALSVLSGLTSGLGWKAEVASGNIQTSGLVKILANVIGY